MTTRIFYFTGSGNALAISRAIVDGLGDAEIVPMAKHLAGYTGADEERIGLITPVYAWGPPRMVTDFAKRLKLREEQYVFAVVTCGGTPGRTLTTIQKLLRSKGSDLNAGFAVRGDFLPKLPGMDEMAIIKFIGWLGRNDVPARASERLPEIIETVAAEHDHRPETSNLAVNLVSSPIYAGAIRSFQKADSGFSASDACTSCGICTRLCPRQNVRLEDGRPVWHGDCEMCYGCMFWCPERAITLQGAPPSEPTHHPDVTVADMLLR